MAPAPESLHLASASPRRRQILTALGIEHTWSGVDIDETPQTGEAPDRLATRLASAKAAAARARGQSARFVLAADTVVALGARVFGKPGSREEALEMLSLLSGRSHEVLTAVALSAAGRELSAMSVTTVKFREIEAIEARLLGDRRTARQGRRVRDPGQSRNLRRVAEWKLLRRRRAAGFRDRRTAPTGRLRSHARHA